MASDTYACLGGTELWNKSRSVAYVAAGWNSGSRVSAGAYCGPELALALEEAAPYSNPTADGAPWVSASEPDSPDFGGFLPLTVDGLGAGDTSRSLTQRANGRGSFIGSQFQESPTITVRGVLFGKTCCSVEYGLRWLRMALQGSCDSDCDGDSLLFLDCCPTWTLPYPAAIAPHYRTLRGVKLVSSPKITNRYGGSGSCCNACPVMEVEFQLSANHPCVYRDPVNLATDVPFNIVPAPTCVTWVLVADGAACPDFGCVAATDCLSDPECESLVAPPTAPAPVNDCICTPLSTYRTCIDIPAGSIPEYTEGLPVLTIKTGGTPLRQVRIRFWLNNLGLDVDLLDPCAACGEITLSYIPPDSTFTFDGVERTAKISCPGSNDIDATPLMGSADGSLPVSWPEIQCANSQFTVCVEAQSDTGVDTATVSLDIVASEC